jgi:hypothetical protein
MRTKPNRRLVAIVLIGSALGPIGLDLRAAQAQAWACTAYEHANFGGSSRGLPAGGRASRSGIDNKISSFRIVRGCHVDAFEHGNFQGPSSRWTGDVPFVGRNWNDLITSWKCECN